MVDGCPRVAVASVLLFAVVMATDAKQPPHIVIILADDMGWNDVGFHGSDQISTPNIDALAYNGVILNALYTPAMCTPSRSALMTGKYPIHTGMQHLVILEDEPWGLPLEERLLPEHLRAAGYRTHAVGKWHLGFFRQEYTPLFRGFDSHYGYYQGFQDYFNHSVMATWRPYDGYDMRRNLDVDWSARGRYSTDVFGEEAVRVIRSHDARSPLFLYLSHLAPHAANQRDPFQAPDDEVARFAHIRDPERRVYAAMVSRMDRTVGEVVAALRAKGMLDNCVIVFMSDNGAPTHGIHSNRGSNHPLRGIKETPWEGGVRVSAAVWSPLIARRHRVSRQLMHMTDWLPTLYSAAGLNVSDLGPLDGQDVWQALVEDGPSPRKDLVHNIDDVGERYAALRIGDWKYINGGVQRGLSDGWYGESGRDIPGVDYDLEAVLTSPTAVAIAGLTTAKQIQAKKRGDSPDNKSGWRLLVAELALSMRRSAVVACGSAPAVECRPSEGPCLFNISGDPCERNNLAAQRPDVIRDAEIMLSRYRSTMVPALNRPGDPASDPALHGAVWAPWQRSPVSAVPVDSPQLLVWEAVTAAVVLVAIVLAIASLLRMSPTTVSVLLPCASSGRKKNQQVEQDEREKAGLTYAQNC